MSFCINPRCPKPVNNDTTVFCESCGSELLLQGRYQVLQKLGKGGFGVTYEVRNTRSNRPEVLKVLTANHPKSVELFRQEAMVLSKLRHSGIPLVEQNSYFTYFPRDSQEPVHCLVMEKIVGMDLEQYLAKRGHQPIEQQQAIDWLKELAGILEQVHQQEFFHRDIKPSNIMIRSTGGLVLIDFGTARQVTETVVNQRGEVTGIISPGYTPFEQINNNAVPQSDFFALGRTFVKLLTGKSPLDREIYDRANDEVRWRQVAPQVSKPFADFIDELMAYKPNKRPANTQVILQRLVVIETNINSPDLLPTQVPPISNPPATTSPVMAQPIRKRSGTGRLRSWIANISFLLWWMVTTFLGIFALFLVTGSIAQFLLNNRYFFETPMRFAYTFSVAGCLGFAVLVILGHLTKSSRISWIAAIGIGVAVLFPAFIGYDQVIGLLPSFSVVDLSFKSTVTIAPTMPINNFQKFATYFSVLLSAPLLGFLQWLSIRGISSISWIKWILATTAGVVATTFFSRLFGTNNAGAVVFSMAPAILAGTQWFVLQSYSSKAYWWIVANFISTFALMLTMGFFKIYFFFLAVILFLLTTGLVLLWLLKYQKKQPQSV
jgi:serine/threonine protein kinase